MKKYFMLPVFSRCNGAVIGTAGLAAALFSSTALAGGSPAASMTWGPATAITGNSDVNTTYPIVAAYEFGTTGESAATINGVLFTPVVVSATPNTDFGNFIMAETVSTLYGTNNFNAASGTYTTLSPAYQTLLGSGAYANEGSSILLTMQGLTVGQKYQFEWWNSLSNPFNGSEVNYSTTATAGTSVTLSADPGNIAGGVGDYDIGTFTASSTAASVSFTSTAVGPEINGFVLSSVTASVPEPTSLSLLGFGALGLLRRRSRRAVRI